MWYHDTKSDDVPGICSSGRRIFPKISWWLVMRATLVLALPNAVCPIRHILGCDTPWQFLTSTQPDPATYDQLVTSHSVDKTDYIVEWACYLFSWSYLLFWVPGLSMYFFKRLPFIIEGKSSPFNLASWTAPPSVTFCTTYGPFQCVLNFPGNFMNLLS